MRIDLVRPLADQRSDAIEMVTIAARLAHEKHENAGGYSMEHALDVVGVEGHPGQGVAQASINRHRGIQDARRRAITAINIAPHGLAISAAVAAFNQEIVT